jgi:hypothetical protein
MSGPRHYRRLPGRRQGLLFGASLWVAEDHVLSVQSWRFREEYRRYYFRDIQTISMTRAHDWLVPAWMVWLPLVAIGPAAILFRFWPDALWAWGWMVAAEAAWWLGSALFGGSQVKLRTAVGTATLKSLHRMRAARKFLVAVEPLVRAAQGPLPEGWQDMAPVYPPAAPEKPRAAEVVESAPPKGPLWAPPWLVAAGLAAAGGMAWLDLRGYSAAVQTAQAIAGLLLAGATAWLVLGRLWKRVATRVTVWGVVLAIVMGVLAWMRNFVPELEQLIAHKAGNPATLRLTTSYVWLQWATTAVGLGGAVVMVTALLFPKASRKADTAP